MDLLFDVISPLSELADAATSLLHTILTSTGNDNDFLIDFALVAAPVVLIFVVAVNHYRISRPSSAATQSVQPAAEAETEPPHHPAQPPVDNGAQRAANTEEEALLANARARLDAARRQQTAVLGLDPQPPAQQQRAEGEGEEGNPAAANEQREQTPNTAIRLPNMPAAPKRVGKKRAANLERKENLRRYREWQVSSQQEQEQKRLAVNAEKDRIAAQKEAEAQVRERRRMREEMERFRRIEREEARKELEEAGKPSVYSMEDSVLEYIENRIVIQLEAAAEELNVRLEELEVYLEEKIEDGEWAGHLDLDQGHFIYLDPARVAVFRQRLETDGKVSKAAIASILLDPTTQAPYESTA